MFAFSFKCTNLFGTPTRELCNPSHSTTRLSRAFSPPFTLFRFCFRHNLKSIMPKFVGWSPFPRSIFSVFTHFFSEKVKKSSKK